MTAGGTADVMQAVQMQPGATRVTEGSDVYTRGGGVTETALLVDGGRVPSLSRFETLNGGLFGALDPFIVRSVRYSAAPFREARQRPTGARDRDRWAAAGATGARGCHMAQASATVRLPVNRKVVDGECTSGEPASFSHARAHRRIRCRATFGGLVASLIANPSRPASCVRRSLPSRMMLAASSRRRLKGPFHAAAGARSALLSSRWMPETAIVIRSSLAGSTARRVDFGVLSRDRDERNIIARGDLEWALGPVATLRAGIEHGRFGRVEDATLPTTGTVAPGSPTRALDSVEENATHLGGYVEAEMAGERASLLVGVRTDRLPGETGASLDPRVSLSTRRGAWTARIGGGLFHQGRWQSAPAIPDAAAPAGAARQARHLVLGLEREGSTTLHAEISTSSTRLFPARCRPQIRSARARRGHHRARSIGTSVAWVATRCWTPTSGRRWSHGALAVRCHPHRRPPATLTLARNGSSAQPGDTAPELRSRRSWAPRARATGDTRVYGPVTSERLPATPVWMRRHALCRTSGFLLTSFIEVINLTGRANTSSVTWDARTPPATRCTFLRSPHHRRGAEIQLR